MKQPHTRRHRGVILTPQGWKKLQAAKTQAEFDENAGDRFTLEELSEGTTLALHTISKILERSRPVPRYPVAAVPSTQKLFFDSFTFKR